MAFHAILKAADAVWPAQKVHAHCDIPCGIYDPLPAQLAAHTVVRMAQLLKGETDAHAIARLTATKEKHAELCKHEIRVLWGDYFRPEHLKEHPTLHAMVWKVMKLGSRAKQENDTATAGELLEAVNAIAEVFWKTKGISTFRTKAPYPTEKETVYPKHV